MSLELITTPDYHAAVETYFRNGWTDGLPVVPPTPDLVRAFVDLAGREPDEVIVSFKPLNTECTVEIAAVNAVMAGCLPEYFPVILAAIECWSDARWRSMKMRGATAVYVGSATTGGPGHLVVVNGPIRNTLGVNSGVNLFGPGPMARANATIGRALRLVLINALGMRPGIVDMATMGHPGKYSYCIAEAEENSPWEPYHVERGFNREDSTVTVVNAKAPLAIDERTRHTAEGVLDRIAEVMPYAIGTGPYVIVMSPEHANLIASQGWAKSDVKQYLHERTARRVDQGGHSHMFIRRPYLKQVDGVEFDYLVGTADDFALFVAGGENAGITAVIPTYTYNVPAGDFVTRAIR